MKVYSALSALLGLATASAPTDAADPTTAFSAAAEPSTALDPADATDPRRKNVYEFFYCDKSSDCLSGMSCGR